MPTRRTARTPARRPRVLTIFDVLRADHRWVRGQLRELAGLLEDERTSATACLALFRQTAGALLAHARAEEEVVYPVFARATGVDPATLAHEEHALVEHLLADLVTADAIDATWRARLVIVTNLVQQHVREEEGPVFRAARRALRVGRAQELADAFRTAKTAAMARMASSRRFRGSERSARLH